MMREKMAGFVCYFPIFDGWSGWIVAKLFHGAVVKGETSMRPLMGSFPHDVLLAPTFQHFTLAMVLCKAYYKA